MSWSDGDGVIQATESLSYDGGSVCIPNTNEVLLAGQRLPSRGLNLHHQLYVLFQCYLSTLMS